MPKRYHISLDEAPCLDPECSDPLCWERQDAIRARIAAQDAAEEEPGHSDGLDAMREADTAGWSTCNDDRKAPR